MDDKEYEERVKKLNAVLSESCKDLGIYRVVMAIYDTPEDFESGRLSAISYPGCNGECGKADCMADKFLSASEDLAFVAKAERASLPEIAQA